MLWLAVHHMFSFHLESTYCFNYLVNKSRTHNACCTTQFKSISRDTCIIPFAFLSISTASIQSSRSTRPISLSKVASAPTEAVIMHLKLDPASVCVLITTRSEHSNHWVLVRMMNERVGEKPLTQTIFGDSRLPTWLPYSTDCCWNSLHQIWYI